MATDTNKVELEIVTPKGRALSAAVDEVTAPSVSGEFGVLPGHVPVLAALRTGIVTYRVGSESKRCAIGAGFAEAGPNRMVILTDEYIERDAIDPVVVRKELGEIQSSIAKLAGEAAQDDAVKAQAKVLIDRENWLAAQLELYGDPPPATMRPLEEWGPPDPMAEGDVPPAEPPAPTPAS
jgi:F-type H+-transporting ATPase subunit epsilon